MGEYYYQYGIKRASISTSFSGSFLFNICLLRIPKNRILQKTHDVKDYVPEITRAGDMTSGVFFQDVRNLYSVLSVSDNPI